MSRALRMKVVGATAVVMGLASVCLPVFVFNLPMYPAPLFPVVRTAVEELSWLALILLFASGLPLGSLSSSPIQPLVFGVLTTVALPLLAVAEIIVAPRSHNLWPFEFLIYIILSLPAVVGAYLAYGIRGAFRKTRTGAVAE